MKKQMDVEALVTWAMLDQGLGWSMFGEALNRASHEDYGTRIQSSGIGAPNLSRLCDDDALVVREVILMLPRDAADLVVRNGRIGDHPDWCEDGVGEMRQMRNRRGQLMWAYAVPGNRRSEKKPLMEWVGNRPAYVEFWRASYRMWWHALAAMVAELNGRLERHEATGPARPLEPWLEPKRVLHSEGEAVGQRRQNIVGAGISRVFVMREGRFERYDQARHGAAFEGGY